MNENIEIFTHSGESELHKQAKRAALKAVRDRIKRREPVRVTWKCEHCREQHTIEIGETAVKCVAEYRMSGARADIALLGPRQELLAVIEVVVTHKPTEGVRDVYKKKAALLVEMMFRDDRELAVFGEAVWPVKFDGCEEERCPDCGAYLLRRTVHVVDGDCWSCKRKMPIAYVFGPLAHGPESFLPCEIEAATAMGASLKQCYSRTVGETYLANTCQCGSFCGEFYIHDYWDLPDLVPPCTASLECPKCSTVVSNAIGPVQDRHLGKAPGAEDDDNGEDDSSDDSVAPPLQMRAPKPVLPAPPPIPPAPTRWGKCENCGTPACPTMLSTSGTFYCISCRGAHRFVVDG